MAAASRPPPGDERFPAEGRRVPYGGRPGASAWQEYERRRRRREAAIDRRWGRFAGVVKLLSGDPQSTRAWRQGSEGERRLAASLATRIGDRAVLLHDRTVPLRRGNIDHLAVSQSGVWVVDTKTYRGPVERREFRRWFRTEHRLYVNRRDRTALVDGLDWQVAAVRTALEGEDAPIHAALCFVGSEWRLLARPFSVRGVWITEGSGLARMIGARGPLPEGELIRVAGRLAAALPPADHAGRRP